MNLQDLPKIEDIRGGVAVGEIFVLACHINLEHHPIKMMQILKERSENYGVISFEMDYTSLEERVMAHMMEGK